MAQYSDSIFLFGVCVVLLASCEIGWLLGKPHESSGVNNHVSAIELVLLGMIALMLGFSFLMASTRFEARRENVVREANAIGTTALRARLLSEPTRKETLKLLREYAQMRSDFILTRQEIVARSSEIQANLRQHAQALSAKDKEMVPTGLFVQSLNEMIDNQAKRVDGLRSLVPAEILIALLAISAVSCGFAGYASRLDPLQSRLPVLITATLVSAVIFVILDLDSTRFGFVKGDLRPMADLIAGLPVITD